MIFLNLCVYCCNGGCSHFIYEQVSNMKSIYVKVSLMSQKMKLQSDINFQLTTFFLNYIFLLFMMSLRADIPYLVISDIQRCLWSSRDATS